MNLIKARDTDGHWTGLPIHRSADGWVLTKITEAPAHMNHWIGSLIDFPPHEIVH